ncbi:MAG TPA: nitronate monooxygenase [Pseudomonadales bacterium]
MPLPASITQRLRLPLIAAPMLLVSGPDLVIAACRAGVIGSFPTKNCRTVDELERWLARIQEETEGRAPYAPNLIVHKTNTRLHDDMKLVEKYAPPLVITSVGSPAPVMDTIHAAGGLVFADVASMRHVERALAVGVDGLILLTAGAGGQTGWANPLAFVRAVRSVFDGPVVLAGGVADGVALRAAIVLGCDLAYMGPRFIAPQQRLAAPAYKDMIVAASLDDIVLSRALTGLETNLLRPSVELAGVDTSAVGSLDAGATGVAANAPRRWKDVWSAGHTVAQVHDLPDVADLVDRIAVEYAAAAG